MTLFRSATMHHYHAASLLRACSSQANEPLAMDDLRVAPTPSRLPRLLVVENHRPTLELYTRTLNEVYLFEVADNCVEASQIAQLRPPTLVILGLYITGAEKVAFMQSLRKGSRTAAIPVVVLTANYDRELLLRCLSAGANNFLLSPFSMSEMLACLRLELSLHDTASYPLAAITA